LLKGLHTVIGDMTRLVIGLKFHRRDDRNYGTVLLSDHATDHPVEEVIKQIKDLTL
jgi:hypothetical protein